MDGCRTTVFAAIVLLLNLITATVTAVVSIGSIPVNFTASHYLFIDTSGNFLRSNNNTYTAAILDPETSSEAFYFVVYHTDSNTVVWSANRNNPISNSGQLRLTNTGLVIVDDSEETVWSANKGSGSVAGLWLLDSGNLVLVDGLNGSLWQSFDHPTDTVVSGQQLSVGGSLIASKDQNDFSGSDYKFTVTESDGLLLWQNMTYFGLLMDTKSVKNSNRPVSSLMVNGSGFYMFSNSGSEVAIQVLITHAESSSDYRILKMSNDGHLVVLRFTNGNWVTDFTTPADSCRNPFKCGKLGLCSAGGCSCPSGFRGDPKTNPGCLFSDNSLSFPNSLQSCSDNKTLQRTTSSLESFIYVPLGNEVTYFEIGFIDPVKKGVNLSDCQDLCSSKCSCLGFFYANQSGSCYLIENNLGSLTSSSNNGNDDMLGFIKAIPSPISSRNETDNSSSSFPLIGLVLIPASGVMLIAILAIWRSKRSKNERLTSNLNIKKLYDKSCSDDLEMFSIAGLPVRFDHEELVKATANFSNQIGSGGFGTVYKGVLSCKTVVAVKKITALGAQGKKEFGTEIQIIGNIHHVNLVKLKGFCAYGRERFLVYEYMSRGSLDRTIFGSGPPLEWQERFEIALGTARGLAYLHNGCEQKIIHCDVKPENILLSDTMQVKISDFGLSKLLTPEQSGLFTTMRGTRGYLAPEWLTNAAISDKTDVYSYGMVLLEVIQGRKNCVQARSHTSGHPTSSNSGQSSGSSGSRVHHRTRAFYFPLHALEMHEEGRYLELVDPRLNGRVTLAEAEKLVKVALCCLHEDPSLRPSMANVVGMLEGTLSIGEPRLDLLNFLRFYGRRLTEPSTAETGQEVEVPSGFMVPMIDSSNMSESPNSYSYLSSQQVSGPR